MTTVNELFYGIRKNVAHDKPKATEIEPLYRDKRLGDILHSHADISMAKKELGFAPGIDINEGLRQTVQWYLENLND